MKQLVPLLSLGLLFSISSFAEEAPAQTRKDINTMFFGGREDNRRFVSAGATCDVTIRNDVDAKTTTVELGLGEQRRAFVVSESDANLIQGDEYDADRGIIAVLTGTHQTSGLKIQRVLSGTRKSFQVELSNGVGFPLACEVF